MTAGTREDPAAGAAGRPGAGLPTLEALDTLRCGIRMLALRVLCDGDLADDVAQETIARTIDAVSSGRIADPARLGPFARAIARHVIADLLRERRRVAHSMPDKPNPEPHPLEALVRAEETERLRAALSTLPARDRDILRLAFFEGLDAAEIGERLREPSARVRKRKQRALERLRSAWDALLRARELPHRHLSLSPGRDDD